MNRYHVAVAAEATAAALFARCDYEVSVQYGANQPGYDLVAVKNQRLLKVSVKGSQDGGWGLLAKYKKKNVSWQDAIQHWKNAQPTDVVMCFVQFKDVQLNQLPRIYLARPSEVAAHLAAGRAGHGDTSLGESRNPKKGIAKGTSHPMPVVWVASLARMDSV